MHQFNLFKFLLVLSNKLGCFEANIDFGGNEIDHNNKYSSKNTSEECGKLCNETEPCEYWTWAKPSHNTPNTCYLKKELGLMKYDDRTISGRKHCTGNPISYSVFKYIYFTNCILQDNLKYVNNISILFCFLQFLSCFMQLGFLVFNYRIQNYGGFE